MYSLFLRTVMLTRSLLEGLGTTVTGGIFLQSYVTREMCF